MIKIKPLQDWIVLKKAEYKHKTLYVHDQQTHRGTVVAVGPGKRLRAWLEVEDPMKGKRFRARVGAETGKVAPMEIKPGDFIEYSNQGWEEREINGEKYIFTRQGSVIGYANPNDTEGLQSHNSAIID